MTKSWSEMTSFSPSLLLSLLHQLRAKTLKLTFYELGQNISTLKGNLDIH